MAGFNKSIDLRNEERMNKNQMCKQIYTYTQEEHIVNPQ
jgi:hypothetical protein